MALLDHGQPADTTKKEHRTGLIAVLAILATLLAAGAWLIVDHQSGVDQETQAVQQRQSEMMAVITANQQAINARDEDGLRATITSDYQWYGSEPTDFQKANNGGIAAEDYVLLVVRWGPGWQETFTGDPAFSGDMEVTIPAQRVSGTQSQVGSYRYTLREVDGHLKIASMVWMEKE